MQKFVLKLKKCILGQPHHPPPPPTPQKKKQKTKKNKKQTRFFPKKPFESILNLYAAVIILCKKLEKFHAFIFQKTLKTSIGLIWGLFWAKNLKTKFFSNNHFVQFQTCMML